MVANAAELDGTAMSWEEFDSLEEIRAEYIDGRVVMAPGPIRRHQDASYELTTVLKASVGPGYKVNEAWSWKPGWDEFVPDIMVFPSTDEQVRYTGTPTLVVGILSTSPVRDLVVKLNKYSGYGLDRYWVVDPEKREMYVFSRPNRILELVQTVSQEPTEVAFGAGVALIDLAAIITED